MPHSYHPALFSARPLAQNRALSAHKGFTLIELIVALGLFSIVMLIAASSYFSAVAAATRVENSTKAINDLSQALDDMANEIRNGRCQGNSQCGGLLNPSSTSSENIGLTSFSFTNSSGEDVTYCLDSNSGKGVIKRVVGSASCSSANALPLTDPSNVVVKDLTFSIFQYETSSPSGLTGRQFWIIVGIKGSPTQVGSASVNPIYLETGLTFRQLTLQ